MEVLAVAEDDEEEFDAIHASPPCHDHSTLNSGDHGTGWLLAETVRLLKEIGLAWICENVVGPSVEMDGWWFTLCGSSFDLGVRRHRRFGSDRMFLAPGCRHDLQPEPVDVTGTGGMRLGPRPDTTNGGNSRKPRGLTHAREVMGIDWMTRKELAQAIPPAYTEWIGAQLLRHLSVSAAPEEKP
jgi:DNA (cytosine-5)-methyltransferase 1